MSRTHTRILCVLAAFAMTPASACFPAALADVSGSTPADLIDPRSGPAPIPGASARRPIRAAFDTINARGSAAGYRVGLVSQGSTGRVRDSLALFRLTADPGGRFALRSPEFRTEARSERCVTSQPVSAAITAGGEPA